MRQVVLVAVLSLLVVSPVSAQIAGGPEGSTSDARGFSVSAEALVWWFKGNATPPLATDGLFNEPGTKVFLGGSDLDTDPNPGFRVTAAYSLTERWGVEGSFLYVPPRSTRKTVSSSGQPGSTDLWIPFIDPNIPAESLAELSATGFFAGSATEELRNSLLGAELNATMRLPAMGSFRLEALGGFRYLRLKETYTFSTDSPNIPPEPADVFRTTDQFETTNNFYGPQVGARVRLDRGGFSLSGAVKVAFGAMVQSVDIDGQLVTNDFNNFGAPQTFVGGYFAQPTNIGSHTRSVFAVVPEVGLTLGYQITRRISVFAGYTFLYVSNVLRAPGQVNRTINPVGVPAITGDPPGPRPGPAQPSFKFQSSDFWAQGLNFGLALRF
jgi:opacity protein-like surface antigen